MSLAAGWLLAPLALVLVCCGLGLLAERLTGCRLPGAVVPAVGLAALIVLAGLPVAAGDLAVAAVPLVALLGAAGLLLGRPWADPRRRGAWRPAALTAIAAFLLYAAPSLLSGHGSIPGWIYLDDSATWLALTAHVLEHGTSLGDIGVSSHAATLRSWLSNGYPVGAFLPLGTAARTTGQDLANAYAPTMAVMAAILALGLQTCAREVLRSPWVASGVAVVGVQASLLYGYTQWGGIKEICTAALLPPAAWCATRRGTGATVLACLCAGALLGVLGTAGVVWAVPLLGVAALAAWRVRRGLRELALAAGVLALAAVPVLAQFEFLRQTVDNSGTDQSLLGNLSEPLSKLQGAGLWPAPDFRVTPDPYWVAVLLAVAGIVAAAAAVAIAAARGRLALPVLLLVVLVGADAAILVGGPWIDAKALAVLSGFGLAAAVTAAAAATAAPLPAVRTTGGVLAAMLVVGAAWSTLAVWRDVNVMSREQAAELRAIGRDIAGDGPSLQLDYNIYGSRYFLRDADADGATDLRIRNTHDLGGGEHPERSSVDVDRIPVDELWRYRALVRRRSPVASHPPGGFSTRWSGRWWEAWTRRPDAGPPVAHLSLGSGLDPTSAPACADVMALARRRGVRRLVALLREPPVIVPVAGAGVPAAWQQLDGVAVPAPGDAAVLPVELPRAGRWRVWVGGSTYARLRAFVDGRDAGSVRHVLSWDGQWLPLEELALPAGRHFVSLRYERGMLPGRHGADDDHAPLGPVALTSDARPTVVSVPARRWRSLCDGRAFDWIDGLR